MVDSDLHTHTAYSDGRCGAEEIVLAAIERGLKTVGISDHSYTAFDESYCMKKDALDRYLDEIAALKRKYEGKIRVLAGIEEDLFSETDLTRFDYAIGSVHYLKIGEKYLPVDETADILLAAAEEYFEGDFLKLAELYFEEVGAIADKKGAAIVGHFDLISKFNEKGNLFSESDPRYEKAWKKAADRLLLAGKTFEINTGAMHRGYRTFPYPSRPILTYLKNAGARFVFGSDSHSSKTLGFAFEEIEKIVSE